MLQTLMHRKVISWLLPADTNQTQCSIIKPWVLGSYVGGGGGGDIKPHSVCV